VATDFSSVTMYGDCGLAGHVPTFSYFGGTAKIANIWEKVGR